MEALAVLFEDANYLVLNKPAGLATHGGEGVRHDLVRQVEEQFGFKPFLVHRLDKETSGAIAIGKSSDAARSFAQAMAQGLVEKHYLALCLGRFTGKSGVITERVEVQGVSRQALTRFKVLAMFSKFSLLSLTLGTGRTHQIRKHLQSTAHPLVGDDKYGDFPFNRELKRSHGIDNLMLHAHRLVVQEGSRRRIIAAPLPEHFTAFLGIYGVSFDPNRL